MATWLVNVMLVLAGALIGIMFSSLTTISKVEDVREEAYRRGFLSGEAYGRTKEMGRSKKT